MAKKLTVVAEDNRIKVGSKWEKTAITINQTGGQDITLTATNRKKKLNVNLGKGNDIVYLGISTGTVKLGAGNDTVSVATLGAVLEGQAGTDTLKLTQKNLKVSVTDTEIKDSKSHTVKDFEIYDVSSGDNKVDLSKRKKAITVTTGAGKDTVVGSAGAMTVQLGTGNDLMQAGKFVGKVSLDGGSGTDTLQITGNAANVLVADKTSVTLNKVKGSVKGFEVLQLGNGKNFVDASKASGLAIQTGRGADTIYASAGASTITDTGGVNKIVVDGNKTGAVTLKIASGNEIALTNIKGSADDLAAKLQFSSAGGMLKVTGLGRDLLINNSQNTLNIYSDNLKTLVLSLDLQTVTNLIADGVKSSDISILSNNEKIITYNDLPQDVRTQLDKLNQTTRLTTVSGKYGYFEKVDGVWQYKFNVQAYLEDFRAADNLSEEIQVGTEKITFTFTPKDLLGDDYANLANFLTAEDDEYDGNLGIDETLAASAGNDRVTIAQSNLGVVDLGVGDDTIVLSDVATNHELDVRGGLGNDTLDLSRVSQNVVLVWNGESVAVTSENGGCITATGIESVVSSNSGNIIAVSGQTDPLAISGGHGDDWIYSSTANADTLNGGAGNDVLVYEDAKKVYVGGSGVDFLVSRTSDLTPYLNDDMEFVLTGDQAKQLSSEETFADFGIQIKDDQVYLSKKFWNAPNLVDGKYVYTGQGALANHTLTTSFSDISTSVADTSAYALKRDVMSLTVTSNGKEIPVNAHDGLFMLDGHQAQVYMDVDGWAARWVDEAGDDCELVLNADGLSKTLFLGASGNDLGFEPGSFGSGNQGSLNLGSSPYAFDVNNSSAFNLDSAVTDQIGTIYQESLTDTVVSNVLVSNWSKTINHSFNDLDALPTGTTTITILSNAVNKTPNGKYYNAIMYSYFGNASSPKFPKNSLNIYYNNGWVVANPPSGYTVGQRNGTFTNKMTFKNGGYSYDLVLSPFGMGQLDPAYDNDLRAMTTSTTLPLLLPQDRPVYTYTIKYGDGTTETGTVGNGSKVTLDETYTSTNGQMKFNVDLGNSNTITETVNMRYQNISQPYGSGLAFSKNAYNVTGANISVNVVDNTNNVTFNGTYGLVRKNGDNWEYILTDADKLGQDYAVSSTGQVTDSVTIRNEIITVNMNSSAPSSTVANGLYLGTTNNDSLTDLHGASVVSTGLGDDYVEVAAGENVKVYLGYGNDVVSIGSNQAQVFDNAGNNLFLVKSTTANITQSSNSAVDNILVNVDDFVGYNFNNVLADISFTYDNTGGSESLVVNYANGNKLNLDYTNGHGANNVLYFCDNTNGTETYTFNSGSHTENSNYLLAVDLSSVMDALSNGRQVAFTESSNKIFVAN